VSARHGPAVHLCLRVGARYTVEFLPFPAKSPLLVIGAGSTLISLTLPQQVEAGHVDFARQLAARAWAYAVAVERCYRGLPPLPDPSVGPVPSPLTGKAEALRDDGSSRAGVVPLRGGEVTA
jgi:hypothetical protein